MSVGCEINLFEHVFALDFAQVAIVTTVSEAEIVVATTLALPVVFHVPS